MNTMNTFPYKCRGRIIVSKEEHIQTVETIIEEIDKFEFEYYYPENLVICDTVESIRNIGPYCIYVGKFEVDFDILRQKCYEKDIDIKIFYLSNDDDLCEYKKDKRCPHCKNIIE